MTARPAPSAHGTVVSCGDGTTRLFRMLPLGPRNRDALLALQRNAVGGLMHPLAPAELDAMLGGGGCVLGGFAEGRLSAFLAIDFPGRDARNLGRDYGLREEDLDHALHFAGVLVHPDLRGNRLHRRLIETAARTLLTPERHRYWFATVRPENVPSVRGMLSVGMRVFDRLSRHDGHDRLLFARDLRNGPRPAPPR